MPPGMALIVTLRGSNYRCLEQIFLVPKGLESSYVIRNITMLTSETIVWMKSINMFNIKTFVWMESQNYAH